MLIEKGINTKQKDSLGRTPEFYFFINVVPESGPKLLDPIENFQSFIAMSPIDFSIQDKKGNSIMHYAAMRDSFLCINIVLKQKKFNLNMQNNSGNTVLNLSMKQKFFNTCLMLLSYDGIDISKGIVLINHDAKRQYEAW